MGDSINPFAVLGVDETATAEEVRAAYHARARLLHPDGLDEGRDEDRAAAEAAMAELNFARELLTDDRTRTQYRRAQRKRRIAAERRGEQLPRHPSWDAGDEAGTSAAPAAPPSMHFAGTYREAAMPEFTVDERTLGTPWVAPRRSRFLRRSR